MGYIGSRYLFVSVWAVVILLIAAPIFAIAAASPASGDIHKPRIHDKHGNSLNWAGYAVTTPPRSVTDVKGSWVVPAVNCSSTPNAYSSFWVGIDGYNTNTVEQTGTDSDCSGTTPTYYAWYEFYPQPSFRINSITVNPGNIMSAEVKYTGGQFTVYITNLNTSQSFTTSAKVSQAKRSSAEWIAEAPSSGGILPLANFSTAYYGFDNTGNSSTNYATVNGVTGPIGSFGTSVQPITMVTSSGVTKAQPSSLSSDVTSFNVTWVSEGP